MVFLLVLMPNTISSGAQIYINSSTVLSATDFIFTSFYCFGCYTHVMRSQHFHYSKNGNGKSF